MTVAEILPLIEDLYRRDPSYRHLQPYELQALLWPLRYTEDLEDEEEIARADESARQRFYFRRAV